MLAKRRKLIIYLSYTLLAFTIISMWIYAFIISNPLSSVYTKPNVYSNFSFMKRIHNNKYNNVINNKLMNELLVSKLDESIKSQREYVKFINHRIRKKDSLYSISRKYNIDIDTLISFNDIKHKRKIYLGNNILVPSQRGVLHKVTKNQSLIKIANKYIKNNKIRNFKGKNNISYKQIAKYNNINTNSKLYPGETIFIPNGKLLYNLDFKKFYKPIKGVITSGFGYRLHPIKGKYIMHKGVDIKARYGTPVAAAKAGKIIYAGWKGAYGLAVIIKHSKNMTTLYGHLSKIRVRKGQLVKAKTIIGNVGSTGLATGPHLHLEVKRNNKHINFLKDKKLSGLKGYVGRMW